MPDQDFVIRPAAAHDLEGLIVLYRHLNPADPALDRATAEERLSAILAQPGMTLFIGFAGNLAAATVTLIVVPNLTRAGAPYALIENVVTHPDWQNRGHGKQLLAHALSYAWSQRCYKVMLLTGRKEESVLRFYESAGFDRHGKQAFIARAPA